MTLHSRMLIGFIAGVIAGLLAFYFGHGPAEAGELIGEKSAWLTLTITYVSGPVGEIFLKLLFMLVIPLVFSALVLGVVEIGDPKSLGRIGGRTLVYILSVSAIAAIIGMLAVNFFQPGVGIDSATAQELIVQDAEKAAVVKSKGEEASAMSVLMNIVPKNVVVAAYDNNLIAVMFFAMMFGIAAAVLRTEAVRSFLGAVQGIYEISIQLIGWVIEVAPFAVGAGCPGALGLLCHGCDRRDGVSHVCGLSDHS